MLSKNQPNEEDSSGTAIAVMGSDARVPGQRGKMHLEQYEGWTELERVRPAWESLLLASPERTIFLTWEWLKPWWNAYGNGQRVIGLAAYEESKELVGLALLSFEKRITPLGTLKFLCLLGDGTKDSDSLDFIVRSGCEQEFAAAVLDWCTQHRAEWDLLSLNTVPAESPAAKALGTELAARRWICWQRENDHQVVHLPGNWEEYFSGLSRKMRKEINQKTRRIEKNYQSIRRRCQSQEELPHFLEQLFDLHTKRWSLRHEAGSFSLPARRQFYAEAGDHLEHVILHDVADRACFFIKLSAPGDAEVFGHRDLHALDVVGIPPRFDQRIGEAEINEVLHRLLAKVMIDAKNRVLGKVAVQRAIQFLG